MNVQLVHHQLVRVLQLARQTVVQQAQQRVRCLLRARVLEVQVELPKQEGFLAAVDVGGEQRSGHREIVTHLPVIVAHVHQNERVRLHAVVYIT